MKRFLVGLLSLIGAACILTFAYTFVRAAATKDGWYSYSCKNQLVAASEVDLDKDGSITFSEASISCDTYPIKRTINGRLCVEHVDPKTGVGLRTVCREDTASAP